MAFTVDQTLHGYNDGHRLIASSLKLSSADSRVMLVMTDLSGSGVKPDAEGYLTGYPLDEVGKYVLARTWSASEMARPGCVWTHSLLIDNADLAALKGTGGLLAAFRRPTSLLPRSEYGDAVTVTDEGITGLPDPSPRTFAVLNALYAAPDRSILIQAEAGREDEALALSIWMQQWPRLRRAFGFCTLAGMDRSNRGIALDLQMTRSLDRQTRSRFPDAMVPDEIVSDDALKTLFADLTKPGSNDIREFLRRTGGDVEGGRRAMIPLCRLHTALYATSPPDLSKAVSALTVLDGSGVKSARNVRALLAHSAMSQIENADDAVLGFVLETLSQGTLLSEESLNESFGRTLWSKTPERFISILSADGPAALACKRALEHMQVGEVISGLSTHPDSVNTIVSLRPDVLESDYFWRIYSSKDDLTRFVHKESAAKVALALASAQRFEAALTIADLADSGDLVAAFESSYNSQELLTGYLQAFVRQPNRLAEALVSEKIRQLSTLLTLARSCGPDTVPNDYGEDPWIVALKSVTGEIDESGYDFMSAFLVSRAFGGRSKSKAALLRFGYGRLYRALQQSRLPSDVERLVTWRLDWGSWFGWDNCSRLRETTVRNFVDDHLDPETFGRLADDGALANSLIDEAARSGRGRRYLAEVRHSIKRDADKGLRARSDYISKKIKK